MHACLSDCPKTNLIFRGSDTEDRIQDWLASIPCTNLENTLYKDTQRALTTQLSSSAQRPSTSTANPSMPATDPLTDELIRQMLTSYYNMQFYTV